MAGGMRPGRGPTLSERLERSAASAGVGGRHCWVVGLPAAPGRWPGLLVEWRKSSRDGWQGRVLYAVVAGQEVVVVQQWLDARHLEGATHRQG